MTPAHILVVEDEVIIAEDIRAKLKGLGYKVPTIALSGKEAIQKATELKPDLILMDIRLKGEMDGVTAAEQIKAQSSVPVNYLTAYADDETLQRAKITTPFGYIIKPFELRELHSNIEMALYKHQLDQELLRNQERYRIISELTSDFAYVFRVEPDNTLEIEWISKAFSRITGYDPSILETSAGRQNLFHSDDFAFWTRRLERVLRGDTITDEYRMVAKNGQVRWLYDSTQPVRDEKGQVVKLIGAAKDITERKQAEEALRESNRLLEKALDELKSTQDQMIQQERMAAVGQLAAGIAHDFNNIMASIILYSDMLLRTSKPNSKDTEKLAAIRQQGRHAADLTQQILDFSRKAVLRQENIDLLPLLEELKGLLRRTLPENIRINLSWVAEEMRVNADPNRIKQAIMNLAANARDAMPTGGDLDIDLDRIQVEPTDELDGGDWIRLSVSDTGCGIPDEALPHIFEPFFTTKQPEHGTGLGLSQVYGIVKQHGGHIDVSTKVGEGTTFVIMFPAAPADQGTKQKIAAAVLQKGQGETILVVEDDPYVQEAIMNCLDLLNYYPLTAVDGREALVIFEEHREEIVLVLSDLIMPEMGGVELAREIKQLDPDVKIVVLTGYPLEDWSEDLETVGVVGWLQKPVNLDQLALVVTKALKEP